VCRCSFDLFAGICLEITEMGVIAENLTSYPAFFFLFFLFPPTCLLMKVGKEIEGLKTVHWHTVTQQEKGEGVIACINSKCLAESGKVNGDRF